MVIASLAVVALIALFVLARVSKSGQPPGIVDGRLAPCPDSPNCVCSEVRADRAQFIEPIEIEAGSAGDSLAAIRAAIAEQGGSIRSEGDNYLAATFNSPLFGFVDDVEIRVDPDAAVIHVRSASRVGRSDLGANRKRIERLRRQLQGASPDTPRTADD